MEAEECIERVALGWPETGEARAGDGDRERLVLNIGRDVAAQTERAREVDDTEQVIWKLSANGSEYLEPVNRALGPSYEPSESATARPCKNRCPPKMYAFWSTIVTV